MVVKMISNKNPPFAYMSVKDYFPLFMQIEIIDFQMVSHVFSTSYLFYVLKVTRVITWYNRISIRIYKLPERNQF
jgi:hypothetical protein